MDRMFPRSQLKRTVKKHRRRGARNEAVHPALRKANQNDLSTLELTVTERFFMSVREIASHF